MLHETIPLGALGRSLGCVPAVAQIRQYEGGSGPISSDQVPIFSGEEWAVAASNQTAVMILVFQDSTSTLLEYRYEPSTNTTTLVGRTASIATTKGHKVRDPNNRWHNFDRVLDASGAPEALEIDGTRGHWTYIQSGAVRQINDGGTDCIAGCIGTVCPLYGCCPCCYCIHQCLGVSWLNFICCLASC